MQVMVKLRSARLLAWLLAVVAAVPYLAGGALAAQKDVGLIQTILMFPLDAGAGKGNDRIAGDLSAFIQSGLSTYARYRVVAYSDKLPAVQRLVTMQPDKKNAVLGPFATDASATGRAAMLARINGADLMVVGTVKKYQFSPERGVAEVEAAVNLVDAQSGENLRTIPAVGRSTKPAGSQSASEEELALRAVKDAGAKVISAITGEEFKEPAQTKQKVVTETRKSGKKTSWVTMLLLSLGVGLLLGSASGGSDGPSGSGGDSGLEPPPDGAF